MALKNSISLEVSGPVAQLGARLNGIQEVEGSIPFGSTTHFMWAKAGRETALFIIIMIH